MDEAGAGANGTERGMMKIIVEAESVEELKELLQKITSGLPIQVHLLNREHPIDEVSLTARTKKTLKCEGILSVGQVMNMTDVELLRLPNVGRKMLSELRKVLPFSRNV